MDKTKTTINIDTMNFKKVKAISDKYEGECFSSILDICIALSAEDIQEFLIQQKKNQESFLEAFKDKNDVESPVAEVTMEKTAAPTPQRIVVKTPTPVPKTQTVNVEIKGEKKNA